MLVVLLYSSGVSSSGDGSRLYTYPVFFICTISLPVGLSCLWHAPAARGHRTLSELAMLLPHKVCWTLLPLLMLLLRFVGVASQRCVGESNGPQGGDSVSLEVKLR